MVMTIDSEARARVVRAREKMKWIESENTKRMTQEKEKRGKL